jgi:VIT1/CCC1 family predicted Fe2+/Mn2+ transporter
VQSACFHAHGQKIVALRAARENEPPQEAYRFIADALPPVIASVMIPSEFEAIRQRLRQLPEPAQTPRITKDEWLAGIGVFLLVVVSTVPVVLPFVFVHDPARALRISNGIAVLLLFLTGYTYGRYTRYRPLTSGFIMIAIGIAMVGTTIVLGG